MGLQLNLTLKDFSNYLKTYSCSLEEMTCGSLEGETNELMINCLTHQMKTILCKFCHSALQQVKEKNPPFTSTETIHKYVSQIHWLGLAKKARDGNFKAEKKK